MDHVPYRYFLIPSTLGFAGDGNRCETRLEIPNLDISIPHLVAPFIHFADDSNEDYQKSRTRFWTWHKYIRKQLEKNHIDNISHSFWGEAAINLSQLITKLAYLQVGDRLVIEGYQRNGFYLVEVDKAGFQHDKQIGNHISIRHPHPNALRHCLLAKGNLKLNSYLEALNLTLTAKAYTMDPFKAYSGLDKQWDEEIFDAIKYRKQVAENLGGEE